MRMRGRRMLVGSLLVGSLLVLVALGLTGGRRRAAEYRTVSVVAPAYDLYTDQQIVDIASDHPAAYLLPSYKTLRPLGHPDFSSADCAAAPGSVGCRTEAIRALGASQGVAVDRVCVSYRADTYRKLPGYAVDSVNGASFDPAWLVRMPGDEFEADLAGYRGGLLYGPLVDAAWAESQEDACCHDGIPGTCGAPDQCLLRYGRGDDVAQTFTVDTLVADLRDPAYRSWSVDRLLLQVADESADCAVIAYKPGFWIHYGGPDSGHECWRSGDFAWAGSTHTHDPCARQARPMSRNPYGPGEFELAMNKFFGEAFSRLSGAGALAFPLITTERPAYRNDKWGWMWPAQTSSPHLAGEMVNDLRPFLPARPPSLSVSLTPPPAHGVAPHLGVTLDVEVRGSATGPLDVHLWCDCADATTDVSAALASCGSDSDTYYSVLGGSQTLLSVPDACEYPDIGTYVPKVIVLREGLAREDRIALNVD